MDNSIKPIIISGGPGSGKSTLIEQLQKNAYTCYSEVSRQIIIEQQAINGTLMPWNNLIEFAEECYKRMFNLHSLEISRLTFCDRGIPDISAYLYASNYPDKMKYKNARFLYNSNVFICPPWKEIYTNDPQRPQSYKESVMLYQSICNIYASLGFNIIEIPKLNIEERMNWLLEKAAEIY